jgi:polyphenol oxidase
MGREGGLSKGVYRSFNLADGVGDEAEAVSANWVRWRAAYPQVRLARLKQVHGNRVYSIGLDVNSERKTGDGMVTKAPGIVLAVFTADCVPVLMVDAERGIAGALHAGWRGTLAYGGRGGQGYGGHGDPPASHSCGIGSLYRNLLLRSRC